MEEYSKEQIANKQLIAAIELFNYENYVPAITLAAASEEILAGLLRDHSVKLNVPFLTHAQSLNGLFEMTKEIHGINNYTAYRNRTRNELKHHDSKINKNIIWGNFKQIALNHILGAIENYKLRKGRLPQSLVVKQFCNVNGLS